MSARPVEGVLEGLVRPNLTPPRTAASLLALDCISELLTVKLHAELGRPREARAVLVDALDLLADLEDALETAARSAA